MRSRSSSLESLICALYLSTVAVSALPTPTFNFWSRDGAADVAPAPHVPDPRVLDFDTLTIQIESPDSFMSQDIPPSYVRPSRRRAKGLDGLPARMNDHAEELDFGPDSSTFSPDFKEEGDLQAAEFWDVMQALRPATHDTYRTILDGIPGFSKLRQILPFSKASKNALAGRSPANKVEARRPSGDWEHPAMMGRRSPKAY